MPFELDIGRRHLYLKFINLGEGSPQTLDLVKAPQITAVFAESPNVPASEKMWPSPALLFADMSPASYLVLKGG